MYRIVFSVIVLILMSIALSFAEWVTFTEEELDYLEYKYSYDWPIKIWANDEQQALVKYAWKVSWNIDFILTIERESWFRRDAVWDWWTSYWLCQWHQPWKVWRWKYSTDQALANWYNMIDKCWESRQIKWDKIWSWLYGYNTRHQVKNRFVIK